ncbi:MAG TPA: sugar phosphate isomerase/epimerase [Firmicutes bacterium]|nr:sugar phosphate isomerase/epimerase [Bacillota bacterium]
MKKGINRWSMPADWSIEKCIAEAGNAGFQGVELVLEETGELSLESDERQLKAIGEMARKAGIELKSLATGLFWKYPLSARDPKVQEKAKEIVVKALTAAQWLGADTILVVPGVVAAPFAASERVPYQEVWDRSLGALRELAPEAEKRSVHIGIENVWNRFLLSPIEMREFIDAVGSDYVGAYFDVGNVLLYGFPEDWIRILGFRIKKVHFKDFRISVGTLDGFVNLLAGDVNWPEVMTAFAEIGYADYVYAELTPYRYHSAALIDDISRAMDWIMRGRGV